MAYSAHEIIVAHVISGNAQTYQLTNKQMWIMRSRWLLALCMAVC